MLDELFGTWLDKRKAKKELCKAYKIYSEKRKSYLQVSTIDIYEQLQDVQYAIAYVLCEYFNVKKWDEYNTSSIKWEIHYDYTRHYDACKEAYERLTKENELDSSFNEDDIIDKHKEALSDIAKRMMDNNRNIHTIYDMKNNYLCWKDKYGKLWEKY